MFKVAKEVPIFKTETRLLCNNFKPTSLLSNIGKIIQKLIHLRPDLFLETPFNRCRVKMCHFFVLMF